MTCIYYKKKLLKLREDHKDWGHSDWLFEVGHEGYALRQIVIYENGPSFLYNRTHRKDEYCELTDYYFEFVSETPFEIPKASFEALWLEIAEKHYS